MDGSKSQLRYSRAVAMISFIYFFIYLFIYQLSGQRPAQRVCARKGLVGPMQGAIPAQSHYP